jgi:hypothetical protein
MDDSLLPDLGIDASVTDNTPPVVAIETDEERAQKRAKLAPLHINYVAPLSFLGDSVEAALKNRNFNITKVGGSFGIAKEAYVRRCYEDIVRAILVIFNANRDRDPDLKRAMLFVIRGSSGVGKSTFLGYFIVRLRTNLANIAVFYIPANLRSRLG